MNLVSRIVTIVMFGAICFAFIVPLAIQRGNTPLAIGAGVLFAIYAGANLILWRRLKARR
jgi:membrane protein implicated in regulation of membrane protease activity